MPLTSSYFWSLGLMSGTSADGVDAALLLTDGVRVAACGAHLTLPYPADFRQALLASYGQTSAPPALVRQLTDFHLQACRRLLAGFDQPVALIGFHGHTLWHDPANRCTVQIGDADWLAAQLQIPVVSDFRRADVAAGGQGAPLVPIFHQALAADLAKPLAVVNIGGVANISYIPNDQPEAMIAFDTGPGNGLIDDWVQQQLGQPFDAQGALAAQGKVDAGALAQLMDHPYFAAPPPKSLDRRAFSLAPVMGLSAADGAATLTAFTAATIAAAVHHLPTPPRQWIIAGGGTQNRTLMAMLAQRLGDVPVCIAEAVGWSASALEAQTFGYLAARHQRGLPISFPGTTGAPQPMTGGVLSRAFPI